MCSCWPSLSSAKPAMKISLRRFFIKNPTILLLNFLNTLMLHILQSEISISWLPVDSWAEALRPYCANSACGNQTWYELLTQLGIYESSLANWPSDLYNSWFKSNLCNFVCNLLQIYEKTSSIWLIILALHQLQLLRQVSTEGGQEPNTNEMLQFLFLKS